MRILSTIKVEDINSEYGDNQLDIIKIEKDCLSSYAVQKFSRTKMQSKNDSEELEDAIDHERFMNMPSPLTVPIDEPSLGLKRKASDLFTISKDNIKSPNNFIILNTKISKRTLPKIPNRVSPKKPMLLSPNKPKRLSPRKPMNISQKSPKHVTPKKPKQVELKKPKRATVKKPKQATVKKPKRTTVKKPKQSAPKKKPKPHTNPKKKCNKTNQKGLYRNINYNLTFVVIFVPMTNKWENYIYRNDQKYVDDKY